MSRQNSTTEVERLRNELARLVNIAEGRPGDYPWTPDVVADFGTRERHLATAITLRETREYLATYGTDGLAEWLLRRENAYRLDDATDEDMRR